MDKRPPKARPPAPKKEPAKPAPARPAKDQESDTYVSAEGTIEPANKADPGSLAQTEMFTQAPGGADDDSAADFLLGGETPAEGAAEEEEEEAPPPPPRKPAPAQGKAKPAPAKKPVPPPEENLAATQPTQEQKVQEQALGATEVFAKSGKAADPEAVEFEVSQDHPQASSSAVRKAPPPKPAPAPAPKPAAEQKGNLLGDYRLLKKLGQGGMGTVFLAQQVSLERPVALKVLSKELASKPAFVQRFLREARVMAKLDHPNILRCYDVKEDRGYHYLAMEYVDGGSLEGWLKKLGTLSLADALHVTLACLRALQHAHELNLVHRDIKPDNLLLTSKGVVKLADLGLAKAQDDDLSLTKTGTGAGTPLYMAPEQARDVKRVDGRSDLYSVGCMLYCFLTGKLPFTGETLVEVIDAKQKGKFTPAQRLNDNVPARLDLIIDKMLAVNPQHRYQNCAEVIADLEELGLEGEHLSFLAAPQSGILKKGPARAPAKKVERPEPEPEAETEPDPEPAPGPKRAAAPASSSSLKKVKPPEEAWYVVLKLPNGKTITKKATFEEMNTLIKSGSVTADSEVSRTAKGGFRALATYSEFERELRGARTKDKADRKAVKFRAMYEQIEKEDERRRRWRWLRNLKDRAGGFLGFVLWLAVVAGILTGLFFGGWWLLEFLADKWNLK